MKRSGISHHITPLLLCATALFLAAGCGQTLHTMVKSRTAIEFSGKYNTPDGMYLDKKSGDIYLSMPNFNDFEGKPATILRIDKNDTLSEVVKLPVHTETKRACPLGVTVGKDGNLYVADNQTFAGKTNHLSRVIRVNMKNGKAAGCEVVAEGLIAANGIEAYHDCILVCETQLREKRPEGQPRVSGVYRFTLKELNGSKPVSLKPYTSATDHDPRLLVSFETHDTWLGGIGANGIATSPKGDLYVCNFGDKAILAWKLNEEGKLRGKEKPEVVVQGNGMESCDGMKYVEKCNKLLVADFRGNAVHMVSPVGGTVITLAGNGLTDGSNGLLDRPSEPCYRDGKVYVANIDLPIDGNEFDKPHTITVLELTRPCVENRANQK